MATQQSQSIVTQMNKASILIANSISDSEIQQLVAVYGYTATRLQAGQQLYETAASAISAQAAAAGAQRRATERATSAEQQARQTFKTLATVARSLFARGAPERTALGLVGPTPQGEAAFLQAAATLFDNAQAIPEIAATLQEYGYSAVRIESERAVFDAFDQARRAQVAAMSAAIEATRAQTTALAALAQWVSRYRTIAATALQANPQLAERIGIAVRSTPTAAQRASAKKTKAGAPTP